MYAITTLALKLVIEGLDPGTDVMILKVFSPKFLAKILAFFALTTAIFYKNLIITLVFEKNAIFSPKIVKIRRKL
jgi:hypothetical protein